MPLENSHYCSLHWNTTGGTITATYTQAHIVKQSSIHSNLKWQDDGHQAASGQVSVNSAFYLEFTVLQYIPLLLFKRVSTSTPICACIGFEQHSSFCICKWNQLSSGNSRHTSCIHKGLHVGKWPGLMTSKPDALGTLGYHWTDCTGTTLAAAIAQWSSNGNPVLICIIGTHWNTTEATSTLVCRWNHTGWC